MVELITTQDSEDWLEGLRDVQAKVRITSRLGRIYLMQRGLIMVVLLWGGDKLTQSKDIAKAKAIAKEWKD